MVCMHAWRDMTHGLHACMGGHDAWFACMHGHKCGAVEHNPTFFRIKSRREGVGISLASLRKQR